MGYRPHPQNPKPQTTLSRVEPLNLLRRFNWESQLMLAYVGLALMVVASVVAITYQGRRPRS